ncbi:hypothetical protein K443DRAFT_108009 [Laccaria amethystina LaAM-08-1]|jgi:hypothetical protein|uniref:Unplaced genomic scaffold K443scaffold_202, whole genome shotgun sequence n=1 Tax=Laccaria amethystina LaAM-08-1 TaxID=1095629 RepID=A0A0C9XIF9_9AGAR|nr:hypothetical protein K443DRAFT_108009 [Laccaria amethystina LaAM-08-1]
MNHFCTFYEIRADLWDKFYFDGMFAYCSKGATNVKKLMLLFLIVFESPVRSGYWVPRGSNRDQDRLGFIPKLKIT